MNAMVLKGTCNIANTLTFSKLISKVNVNLIKAPRELLGALDK